MFNLNLSTFALAVLASGVLAAPSIENRQAPAADAAPLTDPVILNFALALEHLESAFYKQALSNYSADAFTQAGYPSSVRSNIETIAADEAQHVSFLTSALSAAGATPAPACNYTFPATDVKGFLGLAQVLEGVGVSAYLGAAADITNPAYLTAAGSILTVEARHNAFIRGVNSFSPFPAPEDTPQSPQSIITLAAPFFASCPDGALPPITPHPFAAINGTSPSLGGSISITSSNTSAIAGHDQLYCAFASGLSMGYSDYKDGSCQIPSDGTVSNGQIYAFITSSKNLTDSSVLAGPAIIDLDTANNTGLGSTNSSGKNDSASGGASDGASVARPMGSIIAGLVIGAVALVL